MEQAVRTGLVFKGQVNEQSSFDRKHYFYCDLPTGYQITQYYNPIVWGGDIQVDMPDYTTKHVRLERIQLETDSGKSQHDQHPQYTYLDLNRVGSALMEIISLPDIRSPTEAVQFVKKIQYLLKHAGTCDGNMEEGSIRCDANVSMRKLGTEEYGTRCEIKNLNSFKALLKGAGKLQLATQTDSRIRSETPSGDFGEWRTR